MQYRLNCDVLGARIETMPYVMIACVLRAALSDATSCLPCKRRDSVENVLVAM